MLLSNYTIFGKNKLSFIKNKKAFKLLSKLGIRTLLSNIPWIGYTLFEIVLNFGTCFNLIIFEMINLK